MDGPAAFCGLPGRAGGRGAKGRLNVARRGREETAPACRGERAAWRQPERTGPGRRNRTRPAGHNRPDTADRTRQAGHGRPDATGRTRQAGHDRPGTAGALRPMAATPFYDIRRVPSIPVAGRLPAPCSEPAASGAGRSRSSLFPVDPVRLNLFRAGRSPDLVCSDLLPTACSRPACSGSACSGSAASGRPASKPARGWPGGAKPAKAAQPDQRPTRRATRPQADGEFLRARMRIRLREHIRNIYCRARLSPCGAGMRCGQGAARCFVRRPRLVPAPVPVFVPVFAPVPLWISGGRAAKTRPGGRLAFRRPPSRG